MKWIWILLVLTSCATSQGYWVKDEVVIESTFTFPEIHEHYCDSILCRCVYIESTTFVLVDTLEINYYEPKIKVKGYGRSLRN